MLRAIVAVVIVVGASMHALFYRSLAPESRVPWLDSAVSATARELVEWSGDPLPEDSVAAEIIDELLPRDVRLKRSHYAVQFLPEPLPLEADATTWVEQVTRLCDSVPEFQPRAFVPRPGMSVANGYRLFLSSLDPLAPGLSDVNASLQIKAVLRKLDRQFGMAASSAPLIDPDAEAKRKQSVSSLYEEISRLSQLARQRGMARVGPAEYFTSFVNDVDNVYVREANGTAIFKRCVASGLEPWLRTGNGRSTLTVQAKEDAGGQRAVWRTLDLGSSYLFPVSNGVSNSTGKVQLQVRRAGVFTLSRRNWFKEDALRLYGRTGPWAADSIVQRPEKQLWGPSGIFGLLPVALIIVDSPSAAIEINAKDLSSFSRWSRELRQSRLSAGFGGIRVAPKGRENWQVEFADVTQSVRVIPNLGRAHIVGVISIKTPNVP